LAFERSHFDQDALGIGGIRNVVCSPITSGVLRLNLYIIHSDLRSVATYLANGDALSKSREVFAKLAKAP
jgi:hypothetical protein